MLYLCYALGFLSALFVAGLFGLSWMLHKGGDPMNIENYRVKRTLDALEDDDVHV